MHLLKYDGQTARMAFELIKKSIDTALYKIYQKMRSI
jgi:hypothetical protein